MANQPGGPVSASAASVTQNQLSNTRTGGGMLSSKGASTKSVKNFVKENRLKVSKS